MRSGVQRRATVKKYIARDYQCEAVDFLLEEGWPVGLVTINPGAGKSLVLRATAALSTQRVRILITPVEDVEQQLQEPCEIRIGGRFEGRVLTLEADLWVCPRDSDVAAAFKSYIKDPKGKVFVTTHASFRKHIGPLIPAGTSDWHLLGDEFHHSGAELTDLYQFTDLVRDRGGVLHGVTATPLRSDGRPLSYADIPVFKVPYTRLVASHRFPERIVHRLYELSTPALAPSARPKSIDFDHIAGYVREVGLPTVLRVPAGDSARMARETRRALLGAGYKSSEIVDAVNDKDAFRRRLSVEQDLTDYADRTIEVIICCGRMGEASDWPFCTHVVTLGVTTSLPELLQRLGRALRCKEQFPNHPSKNTSYLTMFVGKLDTMDVVEHHRFTARLLEIACVLEMSPASIAFARHWEELVAGLRLPPAVRPKTVRSLGATDQLHYRQGRVVVRALAALGCETAEEMIQLLSNHPAWSVDEKAQMVKDILEQETLRNRELRKALLGSVKRIVRKVQEDQRFGGPVATTEEIYHDHLLEVLLEVASEYSDQLCLPIAALFGNGFEGVLTPGVLREAVPYMEQCRRTLNPFRTDELIIDRIIKPFIGDHGAPPSLEHGPQDISRYLGTGVRYTLRDLHVDLTSRGSSLFLLVMAYQFGLLDRPPLDPVAVREMVLQNPRRVKSALQRLGRGCARTNKNDLIRYLSEPETRSAQAFWIKGPHGPESIAGIELSKRFGWRSQDPDSSLADILR